MRYQLAARATVLAGCLIGLMGCEERSSTTTIEAEGGEIIFSVRWGWGMVQSVGVVRNERLASQLEEDVWEKPYNAGGPVYADSAEKTFYIALLSGLYRIDVGGAKVTHMCQLPEELASSLKYIGQLSLKDVRGRGDGVAFSPAGIKPPVPSGVKAELASLTSGRCG
jgi:hypothetical protein